MTFDLRASSIQAVVVDIEGTTTPIAFVYDVLFPFARRQLQPYVEAHLEAAHLREPLRLLREEWHVDEARGQAPPPWRDTGRNELIASIIAYAEWLMDRDRKAPGLKALQGYIWQRGYRDGILHGDVFPDVPPAFARWRGAGNTIAIFSSGSVLAQELLFRTTRFGDLTRSIDGFFDTAVGAKTSADSYRRIAATLQTAPDRMLFVSDTGTELEAARAAGWHLLMCMRPGNRPMPGPATWETISDFAEIVC